uniref:Uncharacterized protein n=1 Tax=Quercus lobata TaxID=97700 RepID=A0A7N2M4H2_QUELO
MKLDNGVFFWDVSFFRGVHARELEAPAGFMDTIYGASVKGFGYALPKFTQLTVTSYYAASSASYYGISLLTRHIEEAHTTRTRQERLG